jgi:hypothetical protein
MKVEIRNGETISSLKNRIRGLTNAHLDNLQLLAQTIDIAIDREELCKKLDNEIVHYLRTMSSVDEVEITFGLVKHTPTVGDFDQSLINVPVLLLSQLPFNPFIGNKVNTSYLSSLNTTVWNVINPTDIDIRDYTVYDLSSICSFFKELNGYENPCAAIISQDYNDSYGLLSALNDIDNVENATYMAYADTVFVRKTISNAHIPRWVYNIGTVTNDTILVPVTTLYKYLNIHGLDALNVNHENTKNFCRLYKCW